MSKSDSCSEDITRIEKINALVEDKGKYQVQLYMSFWMIWLITAITASQASFLFLQPEFTISNYQICQMPSQQRSKYYIQDIVRSINTDFGPFICEKQFINGILKSMIYIGNFVGLIYFSFHMDNIGRRSALLMTWGTTTFGLFLVSVGINLQLICLGLFLTGAGNLSAIRITISTVNEVFNKSWRQKASVGFQLAYGFAGLVIAILYQKIRNWRPISVQVILFPAIVILVWLYANMQQSSAFLLLTDKKQALKSLNRIGKINKNIQNILTYQDLQEFKSNRHTKKNIRQITFKDVLTLPSLKYKTFYLAFAFLGVSYLYYGPLFIVNYLNVNVYTCMALLSVVQFITIPITILIIEKTPRRLFGVIMFALSSIFTGIMVFLTNKSAQDTNQTLILILMFGFKLSISFYYSIYFLYANELLPIRARGVSIGGASAFGFIFVAFQNIVISYFIMKGYNFMILLTIIGIIALIAVTKLPQTLNEPLLEQIQEHELQEELLQMQKMELTNNKLQK